MDSNKGGKNKNKVMVILRHSKKKHWTKNMINVFFHTNFYLGFEPQNFTGTTVLNSQSYKFI